MTGPDRKQRQSGEAAETLGGVMDFSPEELVEASRRELSLVDEPVLRSYFIDATVDLVLKEHRRAVQALSRRPDAEQRRAVKMWGERHAWRHVASPCLARLIDIVAEFDRRESAAQIELRVLQALEQIGVAPFDVDVPTKPGADQSTGTGEAAT